ncbi:MAG TPA: calcium-binding protein [Allosphingosinicella sp.]
MAVFAGSDAGETIRPDLVTDSVFRNPPGARPSDADDIINGGGGDDIIEAAGGNDIVVGGDGDDQVLLGAGDDIFRAAWGAGNDIVNGSAGFDSYEWRGTDFGNEFELRVSAAGMSLHRDAGGTLNDVERLRLDMGGGSDFVVLDNLGGSSLERVEIDFAAGEGQEDFDAVNLLGDYGADRLVVRQAGPGLTIAGLAAAISIAGMSSGDEVQMFASSGDDVINLSALLAGAPRMLIDGGTGDDLILPGMNADRISGGGGVDTVSYAHSPEAVRIGAVGIAGDGGSAEGDMISLWSTLIGSAFDDTLAGNAAADTLIGGAGGDRLGGAGGDDILNGGAGDDQLDGADGEDRMFGGAGDDRFEIDQAGDRVIEAAGGGTDRIYSSIDITLPANVENLSLDAFGGDLDGTGNALANGLGGNVDANTLLGGGGGDTLLGFAGNDILKGGVGIDTGYGDMGDDRIYGGGGADIFGGGTGRDWFVFDTAPGPGQADTLTDFTRADDTIYLKRTIFAGLPAGTLAADAFVLGTGAQDAEDRVIYDAATGRLFFDPDGTGGAAQLLFARVDPDTELGATDFRGF